MNNREILFIIKMRNMAKATLKQFGQDLGGVSKAADNTAKSTGKARGAMGRFVAGAQGAQKAIGGVETSLNKVSAGSGRAGAAAALAFRNISRSAVEASGRVTGFAAAIAGISGGAALVKGVQTFASFERQMSVFKAVSGASADEMARATAAARKLGADTEFSAGQAAEALSIFAKAGFDVSKSIAATKSTLDLALVGQTDLATAAQITMNVLSQFGLAAEKTSTVVDILAKVDNAAAVNIEDLGESFKYAGTVANSAGVSFNTLAAAFGLLGDAGTRGSTAGTQMQEVISRMLNVMPYAQQVLKDLGLTIDDLDPTDLIGTFEKLNRAGMNPGQALRIFGDQGGRAALLLAGATDKFRSFEMATKSAGGTAAEAAKTIGDNLTGDFRQLGSALDEVAISAGMEGGLGGELRRLVQSVTASVNEFSAWIRQMDLSKETLDTIMTTVKSFGVAIGGIALAGLITQIAKLTGVVNVLRGAFALLTLAVNNFPAVRLALIIGATATAAKQVTDALKEVFGSAMSFGAPQWKDGIESGRQALAELDEQIKQTKEEIATMKSGKLAGVQGMEPIGLAPKEQLLREMEMRRTIIVRDLERLEKEAKTSVDKTYDDIEKRRAEAWKLMGDKPPAASTDTNIPANKPIGNESTVQDKDTDKISKFNEAFRERIQLLSDDARMIGLSADQRERLRAQLEAEAEARKAGVSNVKELVDAYMKEYDALQKVKDAYQQDPLNGIRQGFDSFIEDNLKFADKVGEAWNEALNGVADNLADLVVDGKSNFGDMLKGFGKQLLSAGFKNIMANVFKNFGVNLGEDSGARAITAPSAVVNATNVTVNGAVGATGFTAPLGAVTRAGNLGSPVGQGGIGSDTVASLKTDIVAEVVAANRDTVKALSSFATGNANTNGISAALSQRFETMMAAAPASVRDNVSIYSGYRSMEKQNLLWQQALNKYGSPEAARKWVAPPGSSNHNYGNAFDLRYGSEEARQWMHGNASRFGLQYPMRNEPWHIEPISDTGGRLRAGANATALDMTQTNSIVAQSRAAQQQVLEVQKQGYQQQAMAAQQAQQQVTTTMQTGGQQQVAAAQQASANYNQLSQSVQQAGTSAQTAAPAIATVGTKTAQAAPQVGSFGQGIQGLLAPLAQAIPGVGQFAGVIMQLLQGIGGSSGGLGGGLLGGMIIPGILHSGGRVGQSGYGHSRAVPASLFANARRYHAGGKLKKDEVPIIGLTGERMLNREETRAYEAGQVAGISGGGGSGGGGGGSAVFAPTIPITVQASGNKETDETMTKRLKQEMDTLMENKMTEFTAKMQRTGGMHNRKGFV